MSDSSVSIDMAKRLGCTSRGSKPVSPTSKKPARLPLASTSQTRVRLPRSAASRARPAATVVLPTPPLPVTNSSRRSRRSRIRTPKPMRRSESRGADLDVGDLVGRHADLAAPAVGDPHDAARRPARPRCSPSRRPDRRRRPARCRAPWGCRSRRCGRPRVPPGRGPGHRRGRWPRILARRPPARTSGAGGPSPRPTGTRPDTIPRSATGSLERLQDVTGDHDPDAEGHPVVHGGGAGAPGVRERVGPAQHRPGQQRDRQGGRDERARSASGRR